jgi:DHA1 family putative efflux transporter-like MFS transporter
MAGEIISLHAKTFWLQNIALSVNTSFIQFGFALGSGLGGLVISRTSILTLNWVGLGAVSISLLLAILLLKKMNSGIKTTIEL